MVDDSLRLLCYSRKQIRDAETKQDRQPDLAAAMRDKADHAIIEAENLLLRVRLGQYDE